MIDASFQCLVMQHLKELSEFIGKKYQDHNSKLLYSISTADTREISDKLSKTSHAPLYTSSGPSITQYLEKLSVRFSKLLMRQLFFTPERQ